MAYGVPLPQVPFPYLYTAKLPTPPAQNFPPLRRTASDMASHILNDSTHRNNKPEEPNEGVNLHIEEQSQQQHVKSGSIKSEAETSNLRDYSENSDFGDDENVEID